MSYKDVSNVSALSILNIFCDKMNFSLPPSFNFTCLVALHILEKVHSKRHSWGLKISFLLCLMTQESFLNYPPCMKCGRCCLKVQISYDSRTL